MSKYWSQAKKNQLYPSDNMWRADIKFDSKEKKEDIGPSEEIIEDL